MSVIIRRKILATIISSLLFASIFSVPGDIDMNAFANFYYLNLLFVVSYGVMTSIFSDWLSKKVFTSPYSQEISSFLLHCLFGLVFTVLSLVSAVSFFITDRLLTKINIKWWTVILALFMVVLTFFILINIGD